MSDHVVILGFGMGGQLLGARVAAAGAPYVILDLNGATVRGRARRESRSSTATPPTKMRYTRPASTARKAVVAVLSDPYAAARARDGDPLDQRRTCRSSCARATSRKPKPAMHQGATVAVAEEMEASLEVVAQTFARLDVPGNVIDVLLDSYRRESMGMRTFARPVSRSRACRAPSRKTPIATHGLCEGRLGGRTDAGRSEPAGGNRRAGDRGSAGGTLHHLAAADLKLAAGDVLYLLGDDSDIMLARRRLSGRQ